MTRQVLGDHFSTDRRPTVYESRTFAPPRTLAPVFGQLSLDNAPRTCVSNVTGLKYNISVFQTDKSKHWESADQITREACVLGNQMSGGRLSGEGRMSGRRRYIYVAGCVFGADTVPRRAHGGSQSFAVLSPTRPTSMYRRQRGAHVDGRRRL